MTGYTVVIPTIGRPSLRTLLGALAAARGPAPTEIIVVDDRPERRRPERRLASVSTFSGPENVDTDASRQGEPPVRVLRSGGRGPAAARNVGWRAARTEWVAFLDDDVLPGEDWPAALHADLAGLAPDIGASQGRIEVPPPQGGRRPTDGERGTVALAGCRWITADLAYRRAALERVGGFDERFPRAYREDTDLAMRVAGAGYRLVVGDRRTTHPLRATHWLASVRTQAGNADDVLMRRRHGANWRRLAGERPGRLGRHAATTVAAAVGLLGAAAGRPALARLAGLTWAVLTAEFALRRIAPGPRTPAEVATMIATSVAIPVAACAHRVAGELRWAHVPRAAPHLPSPPHPAAHAPREVP